MDYIDFLEIQFMQIYFFNLYDRFSREKVVQRADFYNDQGPTIITEDQVLFILRNCKVAFFSITDQIQ